MKEGKEDRLISTRGDILGGGKFAALGRDEPIKCAPLHCGANSLVERNKLGRRLQVLRRVLIQISPQPKDPLIATIKRNLRGTTCSSIPLGTSVTHAIMMPGA